MSGDLRVPTLAVRAEVHCADGRTFRGDVFVPAASSRHSGAMRIEEWLNEPASFFPFRGEDGVGVLLNKRDVIALSVPAADWDALELTMPRRQVAVESGSQRIDGTIVVEMPETHRRVVDYLNHPSAFVTIHAGDRLHVVQKALITRVIESAAPEE